MERPLSLLANALVRPVSVSSTADLPNDGWPNAVGQAGLSVTQLDLAPVEVCAAAGPDRDAALWALVDALQPDENLSLRYAFDGEGGVVVSLALRHRVDPGDGPDVLSRRLHAAYGA